MRAMEEEQEQELEMQEDDYDTEEEDWSVSELPSQMPSLATFFRFEIIPSSDLSLHYCSKRMSLDNYFLPLSVVIAALTARR